MLSAITSVTGNYLLASMTEPTDKPSNKRRLSIIIKQLPRDPFSRFFVTEGQFDLREIKFYTQVSDKMTWDYFFPFDVSLIISILYQGDARFEGVQSKTARTEP